MTEAFIPPGDDWVGGLPESPDLENGPVEVVRYSVTQLDGEDREHIWHRQRTVRGDLLRYLKSHVHPGSGYATDEKFERVADQILGIIRDREIR